MFVKKTIRHFNLVIPVRVDGEKIKIPIINGMGFSLLRIPEKEFNEVLRKLLSIKKGAFIDIGANVGQTLIKAKAVKRDIEYHGFEPNLNCCFYINQLIKANKFSDCNVYPIALSKSLDLTTFYSDGNVGEGASLIKGFRVESYYCFSQKVLAIDGDSTINKLNLDAISIIKIDVEGGELEVIQGLKKTIKNFSPFIICEILPVYDEETKVGSFRKERQEQVVKILREQGYEMYRISADGKLSYLECIEVHSDLSKSNYLFVPKPEPRKDNGIPSASWYEKLLL